MGGPWLWTCLSLTLPPTEPGAQESLSQLQSKSSSVWHGWLLMNCSCSVCKSSFGPSDFLLLILLVQKNVKSAKNAQPLFLDLVPAMPMTPLNKSGGSDDSSRGFASQEALTALAETLAKRDAEVSSPSCKP